MLLDQRGALALGRASWGLARNGEARQEWLGRCPAHRASAMIGAAMQAGLRSFVHGKARQYEAGIAGRIKARFCAARGVVFRMGTDGQALLGKACCRIDWRGLARQASFGVEHLGPVFSGTERVSIAGPAMQCG